MVAQFPVTSANPGRKPKAHGNLQRYLWCSSTNLTVTSTLSVPICSSEMLSFSWQLFRRLMWSPVQAACCHLLGCYWNRCMGNKSWLFKPARNWGKPISEAKVLCVCIYSKGTILWNCAVNRIQLETCCKGNRNTVLQFWKLLFE